MLRSLAVIARRPLGRRSNLASIKVETLAPHCVLVQCRCCFAEEFTLSKANVRLAMTLRKVTE
jgi:hypothetical protein